MMATGSDSLDFDAPLVARARRGDHEAFAELHRRHAGPTARLVRWLGGAEGGADVEDLVQEAFVAAWRGLAGYRGEAPFGAWLLRISARLAVRARHKRRRSHLEGAGDTVASPESAIAARLTLEEALQALPATARQVYLLHEMEAFSHQEIADTLGLSEATSRSHLRHARARLRQWLKEHG